MHHIQIIHVDMRRNKYVCKSFLQRYFKSSEKYTLPLANCQHKLLTCSQYLQV